MKKNKEITSILYKGLFVFWCALAISCSSDSPVEETGEEPEKPTSPEEPEEPEEPVAAKVYTVDINPKCTKICKDYCIKD